MLLAMSPIFVAINAKTSLGLSFPCYQMGMTALVLPDSWDCHEDQMG